MVNLEPKLPKDYSARSTARDNLLTLVIWVVLRHTIGHTTQTKQDGLIKSPKVQDAMSEASILQVMSMPVTEACTLECS